MAKAKRTSGAEAHYESPRKRRRRPKPKMQPPLTSMIDVTFQLLLFFLIAANFSDEGNIEASVAEGAMGPSPEQPDVMPVVVIVSQEGSGKDSRPVYAVKVTDERLVKGRGDLPVGEYRRHMAGQLHDVLYTIRSRLPKETVDDVPAIIKVETGYGGSLAAPSHYVRWQYGLQAYNQAKRAGFKKILFQK